jgi:phage shock protein C
MYCSQCGKPVDASARFCPACGTATATGASVSTFSNRVFPGQLTRPRTGRMIAGICAGLVLHYGWDLSLVRVLCALLMLCTGIGLVAYLIAWVVIPEEPYMLPQRTTGTSI